LLKIRTIGCFDQDRKSRRKLQKIRKRERDRIDAVERRRAKGALPRAEYEARSLSDARPWREMGISRATKRSDRITITGLMVFSATFPR
jgi:hypothetical protein